MSYFNLNGELRFRLLDALGGVHIRETLKNLRKEQYLPYDQLMEINKQKFSDLFELAKKSTAFYEYTQSYEKLEVLEKDIVRAHFDAFVSKTYAQKLYKKATGGSTGLPLVYLTTAESRSYMWAGIILSWQVAGYKLGDKVAFIAGSALLKNNWKHKIFYKLFNINLYSVFDLTDAKIASYLKSIHDNRVTIIYGYASAINYIASYIQSNPTYTFPYLKGICCTSEVLTQNMRANIQSAFKVEVYNQYGCNEAGVSAFECEHHKLHLINSRSYHEVDIDNNFISTDLSNKGFIMLKYNTGDKVKFLETKGCDCGRNYPIIENVIGRTCDIIVDSAGNCLHSFFFHLLFRNDNRIMQFQVRYNLHDLNIYLSVDKRFVDKSLFENYMQEIKNHLHFDSYNLYLNTPFLTKHNAKHAHLIKE